MKIEPCGFRILVEVFPVKQAKISKNQDKIVLPDEMHKNLVERQAGGRDIGVVLSFGPVAYKGYDNCETNLDYGVEVGDIVEFDRYDGKFSRGADYFKSISLQRIINDRSVTNKLTFDSEKEREDFISFMSETYEHID